jgi:site-specific DNA-adenine methylase
MTLKAPFPYFGGKSAVAGLVWNYLGDVPNYVEPFAGSCAMLLGRPSLPQCETINDVDGFVANFWRAVQYQPGAVAEHADWPVNENDLHARHAWLVGQKESLQASLEGDPDYFDVKIAGWWCWGMCCWIGSGFCSGKGPWQVVNRQLVHVGDKGRGVNRQRVHVGDKGRGVNRKRENLTNDGVGLTARRVSREMIVDWMHALADRLRTVRVCCGDWQRITGSTPTVHQGLTGVFLDPPYSDKAGRASELYRCDDKMVAQKVHEWCLEHADEPKLRIALCGYEGEHEMPESWTCIEWKARGGYGSQRNNRTNENSTRERVWFSPHCLAANRLRQRVLF